MSRRMGGRRLAHSVAYGRLTHRSGRHRSAGRGSMTFVTHGQLSSDDPYPGGGDARGVADSRRQLVGAHLRASTTQESHAYPRRSSEGRDDPSPSRCLSNMSGVLAA